ncbi:hypothetical protein [endosymbiont of Lamellibrachia barhami]|uniref:hypothetical protein n=1 Tax=endosymbiont of Lamellibrachia barhami TaxID=205975 RepID=UPI0015AC1E30|nr:hypothetical protein [endosymbiont of Lamellibrachia barhami]
MLGILLKLIDRIIEYLKTGQQNREKMFKEIIEPLFNEMTLAVQDYQALFRENWGQSKNTIKYQMEFLL